MDLDCSTSQPDLSGPDYEVGVCDEGFRVYARIVMRRHGARRLESDLADMGFESVSVGATARMRGCDVLVVRRAAEPALALS